jgi:hypothetical protein
MIRSSGNYPLMVPSMLKVPMLAPFQLAPFLTVFGKEFGLLKFLQNSNCLLGLWFKVDCLLMFRDLEGSSLLILVASSALEFLNLWSIYLGTAPMLN